MRHAAANPNLSAQPQQPVLASVRNRRRQSWRPHLCGRKVGRQHGAVLGCHRAGADSVPNELPAAVGRRRRLGAWSVSLQAKAGRRTVGPPGPSEAWVPGARPQRRFGESAYSSVGDGRSTTGLRQWGSGGFFRLRRMRWEGEHLQEFLKFSF